MALNEEEKKELVVLLDKIENKEIRGSVWHSLVKKFITVPIELCIFDEQNRILLVYRKDSEFDGYHMPGSVVNDWETVEEAKERLIREEITIPLGIEISEVEAIGWLDSPKDSWPGEPSTRHGILLLHVARYKGIFIPKEGTNFFALSELPDNTLGCHRFIIPFFERYLKTGQIVLGK
ncbi:MAG: NUDIX hydrolase [Candidatus Pacebacteria bacterium]|nr:NUDIX hydrolase [Candidatus Paceibacterota bacterium]